MSFRVTQCPSCESTFNINPRVLLAAQGRVRCGACLTVFEAEENFLPQSIEGADQDESVFVSGQPEGFFDPSDFLTRSALQEPDPVLNVAGIDVATESNTGSVQTELAPDPFADAQGPSTLPSAPPPRPPSQLEPNTDTRPDARAITQAGADEATATVMETDEPDQQEQSGTEAALPTQHWIEDQAEEDRTEIAADTETGAAQPAPPAQSSADNGADIADAGTLETAGLPDSAEAPAQQPAGEMPANRIRGLLASLFGGQQKSPRKPAQAQLEERQAESSPVPATELRSEPEQEEPEARQAEDIGAEATRAEAKWSELKQAEAEKPAAVQPEAEEPQAEQTEADEPLAEQLEAEELQTEKPEAEQPETGEPQEERTEAEQSETDGPQAEHLEADEAQAEQSEAEQTAESVPEAPPGTEVSPTDEESQGAAVPESFQMQVSLSMALRPPSSPSPAPAAEPEPAAEATTPDPADPDQSTTAASAPDPGPVNTAAETGEEDSGAAQGEDDQEDEFLAVVAADIESDAADAEESEPGAAALALDIDIDTDTDNLVATEALTRPGPDVGIAGRVDSAADIAAIRARALQSELRDEEALETIPEENLAGLEQYAPPVELQSGRSKHRGRQLAWTFSAALLALVLAGQYLWQERARLSLDPTLRPLYLQACTLIACRLPVYREIGAIRSETLSIRSHPTAENSLSVNVEFRNTAPFPQPFPVLILSFNSASDSVIALREFAPEEYLGPELASRREMPVMAPVQIELAILDPGPDAINYTLAFRAL